MPRSDAFELNINESAARYQFRRPSIMPLKGAKLDDLELANILNGETCPPISFRDFTKFVTDKEHTTENLLFVIWYKSYEARWNALGQAERQGVPIPSTNLGDRYSPFKEIAGTVEATPNGQPMREEAARAYATFLAPGGSRALGVSDELRMYAQTTLARSTAPQCFLPVYEDVYHAVETQSLPHFLSIVSANVNRPKQLFWYYVGAFDFLLGLAIYLVLTLTLSSRNFGFRATRLPSTLFTAFGSMQMYSAWRGFCSQVWNRKSRQLWPWELDEVGDEEEAVVSVNGKAETEMTDLVPALPVTPMEDARLSLGPQSATSLFSENIFTPTSTTMEDNGTTSPSFPMIRPIAAHTLDETEEMTEVQRGQLALRRATIKVPDASLAFPISDVEDLSDANHGSRKPSHRSSSAFAPSFRPSVSSLHSASVFNRSSLASPVQSPVNKRSDISPFEEMPVTVTSPAPNGLTRVSIESVKPVTLAAWPPLSTLLARFSRTPPEPLGKKPKMFGPEAPVEDPRVTALFESIVRDILVVGAITGVIWVALCLAVPCAGLV